MDDLLSAASAYECGRITMAYILGFRVQGARLNANFSTPGETQVKGTPQLERLFKRVNDLNILPDESTEETARNMLLVLLAGSCSKVVLESKENQDIEIEVGGKDYSQISLISAYLKKHFGFDENEFLNSSVNIIIKKFSENSTRKLLEGIQNRLINNPFEDLTSEIETYISAAGIEIKQDRIPTVSLGYDDKMESDTDNEIRTKAVLINLLRKVNPQLSELAILNYSNEILALFSK